MEKSQPQPTPSPTPAPAPEAATQVPAGSAWPGAFGLYKYSSAAVKFNLNTYLLLAAANIVVSIVLGIVLGKYMWVREIISSLISVFIGTSLIYANVASAQRQSLEFDRSLSLAVPVFLQMLLVNILVSLMVIVGLILLIVPGLIISVRLSLAGYYVADQKLDAIEAIKASWAATKGNSGKVWGIVGVTILMILPVFTIIGIIATIFLLFMYQAALGLLYVYLKGNNQPKTEPQNG